MKKLKIVVFAVGVISLTGADLYAACKGGPSGCSGSCPEESGYFGARTPICTSYAKIGDDYLCKCI